MSEAELCNSQSAEEEIEKEAEKAFENLVLETQVLEKINTDVDDEEFERVWRDETCHQNSDLSDYHKQLSDNKNRINVRCDSADRKTESIVDDVELIRPSTLYGFQTVSLSALPGSRLIIERSPSETSGEASNGSFAISENSSVFNHDMAITAENGNKHEILAIVNPVNSLEQAQAEWKMVKNIQTGENETIKTSPEVSFREALEYFRSSNTLDQHMSHIKPTVQHNGCSAFSNFLFGPPKMKRQLNNERCLVFALALCVFNNDEEIHNNVLQTIYKRLAGTKLDCPRYGNHWQVIGFQGLDPSTDLRGCGFLGLMNILYLVTEPRAQSLATNIYKLSLHETQNFPFSVMSINITRIALQTLREGKLNRICNSRGTVMDVFNEFYAGVFYRVYTVWKNQRKTMSESGFVLREIEKNCKNHTSEVLRDFSKVLSEKSRAFKHEETSVFSRSTPEKVEGFSGVCEIEDNEEDDVHLV